MTTTSPSDHDPTEQCIVCGSTEFFLSLDTPIGYFCAECGAPDAATQERLDFEEPGYW